MRRPSRLASSIATAAMAVGLVLNSLPALAVTPAITETYEYKDTYTHPGITCTYGAVDASSQDLRKLAVYGPKLFARDRTSGVDTQKVAWRFVVEGAKAGVPPYVNYYSSSWLTSTANDSSGHKFGARTWTQSPPAKNKQWKVHVEMRWYKPGSSSVIEATIKIFAQYYTSIYPPNDPVVYSMPCLPGM